MFVSLYHTLRYLPHCKYLVKRSDEGCDGAADPGEDGGGADADGADDGGEDLAAVEVDDGEGGRHAHLALQGQGRNSIPLLRSHKSEF